MQPRTIPTTIQPETGAIGEADMATFKVLIVDSNLSIREGLCAILDSRDDIEVVAAAPTVDQAIEDLQDTTPDVVLADAQAPDGGGVGEIDRIAQQWPNTKVIALAVHSSITNAALAAGAAQVLLKDVSRQLLLDAVRTAVRSDHRDTD